MLLIATCDGDSTLYTNRSEFYKGLGIAESDVRLLPDTSTRGRFAFSYPIANTPNILACNLAVPGSRLHDQVDREPYFDAAIPSGYPAASTDPVRKWVHYIRGFSNPEDPDPDVCVDTWLLPHVSRLKGYATAKNITLKIMLGTVQSRGDGIIANFDTAYKNPLNVRLLGLGTGDGIDGVADFTVHSEWSADGACNNSTYFEADLVHCKTALFNIVYPTWRTAFDAIVATF